MIVLTAILSFVVASLLIAVPSCASTIDQRDYVVLLHGMGRTSLSMKRMEWYLSRHGYCVINVSYHSRRFSVEKLADIYLQELLAKRIVEPGCQVHFVTHSLGGIIVRQYLAHHEINDLGRVVMLAPPNHGSEIIDHLQSNCLTQSFLGAAAKELGTDGLPAKLGPVSFECGVIAGDRSANPFFSALLPEPNDGKVTVESTRVQGMRDFRIVHGTHTWLMWKPDVLRQTFCFLNSGRFDSHN